MDSIFLKAEDLGIRLEIVDNLPIWEASPAARHQLAVERISASIQPVINSVSDCACVHISDVYVQFPHGSLKRPDISVFCRLPNELDEAVTLVPEAVVEVISRGYEVKDLKLAPPFYLRHGVKDVVIFNPYTLEIFHYSNDGMTELKSPAEIEFKCGCRCVV